MIQRRCVFHVDGVDIGITLKVDGVSYYEMDFGLEALNLGSAVLYCMQLRLH